jgi:HEAT repeat protein
MLTGKVARVLTFVVTVALVAGCTSNAQDLRAKGDTQGLVDRVTSGATAQERAEAATALGQLAADQGAGSSAAAEARDHLTRALDDSEPTVRAAAVFGLGGLGVEAVLPPILEALEDDSSQVQQAAEQALSTLLDGLDAKTAIHALVDLLDHESPTVRSAAVTSLGDKGDGTAIVPLLEALDDADSDVRSASSDAVSAILERTTPADAATVLADALSHDSETVRAAAAGHLGAVGTEAAITPLLETLGDSDSDVRSSATAALTDVLGRLPDPTAVGALLDATGSPDQAVATAAAATLRETLATLGPERAVQALATAESGDAWFAEALGVPVSRIAAETRLLGIQLDPIGSIEDAATAARSGRPVVGAHRYAATSAYHPAILFTSSLDGRESWTPTALRFLELVVTEKASWQRIQVCRYYGPDISRYRKVITFRMYSAFTGKVVATRAYKGPSPRACRQTEPYDLTRLEGGEPSVGGAYAWLDSLIHPPK